MTTQNITTDLAPFFRELNGSIAEKETRRDASDKAFFAALLPDDLVFFRASGTMVGKKDFMDGLDKPDPFVKRTMADFNVVSIEGEHAVIYCIIDAWKKDDPTVYSYRNIRIFSKGAGGWQLRIWYNYAL